MNEGTPQSVMSESNKLNGSLRRRSPRLSSPSQANIQTDKKMATATAAVCVKRSITVRKIAPRKTVAPSEHNKENTPRRSGSEGDQQKKQKVSTPAPAPDCGGSSSEPAVDPEDAVWSQKVRRSYSRLSDNSFSSPDSRETLFGFEKLQTPEVVHRVRPPKRGLEALGSLSCLNSFTSLLEADDRGSAFPEPDPNIPGVAVVREKRRRKKVQQIDTIELDTLAAEMNAMFEEAEEFQLVVE
uniref:Cell division cycle associated 5 n=1 Tax=Seriola lalandi dorsalis TaxID=1841481 RepID=A0A3B4YB83_SERLL